VKVVVDTNVLLMSIPKISKYRPIFDGLLKGKFNLAISESILQEYIEIIGRKTTGQIAQNLVDPKKCGEDRDFFQVAFDQGRP
jgi:predicted nucleic acid-binding protein